MSKIQNLAFGLITVFTIGTSARADVTSTEIKSESAVSTSSADSYIDSAAPKLMFRAGPGFSTITTSDTVGTTRTGLNLNADLEIPLAANFSLMSGLSYVQKGQSFQFKSSSMQMDASVTLNYLEVLPAVANLNLPLSGFGVFTLSAGPYAAFAVSRGMTMTANNPALISQSTLDQANASAQEGISSFDLGLRFGTGIEVPVSHSIGLLAGVGYELGVMNIDKTASSTSEKVYNRSLMATLGMGVRL